MSQHLRELEPFLRQLGINPNNISSIAQLNGGASSSCVYRLEVEAKGMVLKFTSSDTPPYVYQRAVREYQMYSCFAGWLPQLRPELLAAVHDNGGIALLLSEYIVPARERWTLEWLRLVLDAICEVHASLWSSTNRLSEYHWLRRPASSTVSSEDKTSALQLWQQLLQRVDGCGTETMALLERLIQDIDCLLHIESEFPKCLCHGDFHAGNILTTIDGKVIISDWQEVGIGRGPEDISFFLQRAQHSGFAYSRDEVIALYTALLNEKIPAPVSQTQVQRIISASDLVVMLLHWPFYLQQASANTVQGFTDRIEQSAGFLGLM